tara:strand:- start:386 stop:577 length:192 start_codon:yes stop_codon:yes gene_type:complete
VNSSPAPPAAADSKGRKILTAEEISSRDANAGTKNELEMKRKQEKLEAMALRVAQMKMKKKKL